MAGTYSTDIHSNITALNNVSGTNTGDQDLSGKQNILNPISISTNTTAVANNLYIFTANLTLTLPASPTIGDRIGISNRSDVLTCVIARNGSNIAGLAEDMTVDALNIGFELVYTDATQGWVLQ